MTVSAKTRLVRTIKKYFLFTQQYQLCPRNGTPKFQPFVVRSFGIISLDSRKSKVIDLYSDYTKNKLQVLTFTAITSIWVSLQCYNLALNIHHRSAHQPKYSISPLNTCICDRICENGSSTHIQFYECGRP